jgi:hypothetical protein
MLRNVYCRAGECERLTAFARLVRDLRSIQRSNGMGYKTGEAGRQAASLERMVDSAVAEILKPPVRVCSECDDSATSCSTCS